MDDKDSFALALKKAREIAAKMQVNAKPIEEPGSKKSNSEPNTFDAKKRLALQIANNLSRRIPKDIRVMSQGLNRDGELVVHMMIPTILVCLFSGRNNETLGWMQETTGVRMEMNMEHPYANSNEKPLTIIGEPDKVESAREVVSQYIREKDELLGINANNMQVSLGIEYSELQIPKEAVGLVIGKQGENIKKVNNETGCMVKFKPPGPHDDDRYRVCTFHGTTSQIKKAREQISELVEYLKQKFGLARPVPGPGQEFEEVRVSASKAGIVIGKGGENIKQINNLSGATVCIDRSVGEGAEFRTFFVVGSREQVEHAKFLIREKSGEISELPMNVIMSLNPLMGMDPWANQPPMPPMFANPMNQGFDPSMSGQQAWYPSPMHPTFDTSMQGMMPMTNQDMSGQPENSQEYNAAWASYYQQYYPNYPSQTTDSNAQNFAIPENVSTDPEAYVAYLQSYCQQYYPQNPEYFQQLMAAYREQQNPSNTESCSIPQQRNTELAQDNTNNNVYIDHSQSGNVTQITKNIAESLSNTNSVKIQQTLEKQLLGSEIAESKSIPPVLDRDEPESIIVEHTEMTYERESRSSSHEEPLTKTREGSKEKNILPKNLTPKKRGRKSRN